jgi:hypothetical protein
MVEQVSDFLILEHRHRRHQASDRLTIDLDRPDHAVEQDELEIMAPRRRLRDRGDSPGQPRELTRKPVPVRLMTHGAALGEEDRRGQRPGRSRISGNEKEGRKGQL